LSTEEEIREYLETKKLRNINLPQDSNTIDQGEANAKEVKIGQKNLAAADKEKRLARALYIQERDKKIQFGDKQAIAEYMQEASELRQRLEEQKERSLEEYQFRQEEKSRLARESKITDEDRQNEKEDIQKLERKRDKEINDIHDYFNCPEEEWQEYLHDNHTAEESLARVLIERTSSGVGYCCGLHRYQPVFESPTPDRRLVASCFTIEPVEQHFRTHDPQMHKQAIIDTINEKYASLIQERRDKTLEDKEVAFKREIRDIEAIKTRPGGDYGLLNSGTKITKGERAKIRRQEESENERNRKIYRGLYS
jgi:hypothetical protein